MDFVKHNAKFGEIVDWHYNQFTIVTRIPELVAMVWELGYKIKLERLQCTPAPSEFNGGHSGPGTPYNLFLARDENKNPLLITPNRYESCD